MGQSTVDTIRVLNLNEEKNYKEDNKFWKNSNLIVRQEVAFNDPNVIDEEYTQLLTMTFLSNPQFNIKKDFDLITDSLLIRCSYRRVSVWHWKDRKTQISGQVKIVSQTKRRIKVEFNLIVTEPNYGVYVYKGMREFRKSKPLETDHY